MAAPLLDPRTGRVSPLELFFDLVFVFGVSQLSRHLAENLGWRGAVETAVILIAVFGVWAFASFGATLAREGAASATFAAVLVLSLFIDAAILRAFSEQGLLFLVPFLVCRVGQVVAATVVTAPRAVLLHHRAVLVWVLVETALWIGGAVAGSDGRLGWWAGAALVNVVGFWAGHPLPGRRFASRSVPFVPARMIERSRLLLLIALGEVVLGIGGALSSSEFSVAETVAAALALATTSVLWFVYFREADPIVDATTPTASDAFAVARVAINSQLVVLAGLVALSVASETAIHEPLAPAGIEVAVTLHGGVVLYLGSQSWYLRRLTQRWSRARLLGIVVLVAAAPVTAVCPALVGLAVVTSILVILALAVHREGRDLDAAGREPGLGVVS